MKFRVIFWLDIFVLDGMAFNREEIGTGSRLINVVLTYGFLDWKLNLFIHHFRYKEKPLVFRRGVVTYIVTAGV